MPQFSGLRVLELASVLAGPSVGQFFAELGAEVIKVENVNTAGDVTRSWRLSGENTDDRSAYFCSVNWGKKSIAVDLTKQDGKSIVSALAGKSDIVIASYKPGDAQKLGVDYATLSKENPSLIYGQITGYGSHNPRVGYDAIIQAEAGFMFMNGEPGRSSLKMPVALMDVIAGHHLKEGLLLAMLEKASTGRGKLVEVSLIQAAVSSLANQATNWLVAGRLPKKQGSAHPNIAPYGDLFTTADNKELILAVGTDGQFQKLCHVLGVDHLSADDRFRSNGARVVNRTALRAALADRISVQESEHLVAELTAHNVPAAVTKTMAEVFDNIEASEMVLQNGELRGLRNLATSNETDRNFLDAGVPHLGQHSYEILIELGFASQQIDRLTSDKTVLLFQKPSSATPNPM